MGVRLTETKPVDRVKRSWQQIRRKPRKAFPRYFSIKNKAAERIPLKPNATQRLILDAYEQQRNAGKPVRLIILKARQTGSSTICEGLIYSQTGTDTDVESLIVAHDLDSAAHLLSISNLFYADFDEDLRPLRRTSNRREVFFDVTVNPVGGVKKEEEQRASGLALNSRIRIDTANDVEIGRSHTIQNAHLSEFARWPDPKQAMLSIKNAVPNLPNTMILIESTAKGVGNAFHRQYVRAKEGKSEFLAVFIPWWVHEEYVMPAGHDFKRTPEEIRLADEWGLDTRFGEKLANDKLRWRRWCIAENCDGDLELFQQEYPGTDDEAFISSGVNVFNFYSLRDFYMPIARAVEPEHGKKKFYAVKDENEKVLYKVAEHRIQLRDEAGKILWEENPHSELRVYRGPKEGRKYVISCDPSEGNRGQDYTCIQVLDRMTREQCAVWHGWQDPDLVAEQMVLLAKWYNWAWLWPERNAVGVAVINRIRRLKYHRLYHEFRMTDGRAKQEYGWRTTQTSKPALIAAAQSVIRNCEALIYHKRTVDELNFFVRDGRKMHGDGIEDDCVMAWAIGILACERLPQYEESYEPEQLPDSDLARLFRELVKEPKSQDRQLVKHRGKPRGTW